MRIGIFTDTFTPQINGVVTSIEIFRKELTSLGHTVYVFAPKVNGYRETSNNVYRFLSIPFTFQKEYRIIFPYSIMFHKLHLPKLDIIHSQTPFALGLLGLYLARRTRTPLVYTHHTLLSEYVHYISLNQRILREIERRWTRNYCNRCTLVLVPSSKTKDLLKDYGVNKEIAVVPTGIDLESFDNSVRYGVRERPKLGKETKLLLYVGRLGKEKNLEFLLKSFRVVLGEIGGVYLMIVGDGPERRSLQALSRTLGINKKIAFCGYLPRNEVIQYYKAADLFVFSSTTETEGLSVLEAMAAGTPVVAIDAMGISDLFKEEKGAILCQFDVKTFSSAICKMLLCDTLRHKKAKDAQEKAEEISSRKMTKTLLEYYTKARINV